MVKMVYLLNSSVVWFPVVKNPPVSAGEPGLITGLGRSPGVGNGYYSSILACMHVIDIFLNIFFLSTLFFLLISEWLSICFFNIYFYLFISLTGVLVAAHGIFSFLCSMRTLSCSMWDLIPQPGIKPRPPALAAWSLSHWTTGEVPANIFLMVKPSSSALLEI